MNKPKGFTFTDERNNTYTLTEREKKFCEVYCNFGESGADAVYAAGYQPTKIGTAYSIASENLRKPKILAYISSLYKDFKFSDEEVFREHLYLIRQHYDLPSKARAIDMYYKKTGVYKEEKQEAPRQTPYEDMTDEELQACIDAYQVQYLRKNRLKVVPI